MSQQIANAFEQACLTELQALKPGNVHIFADGHGMVLNDFINSAHAAASVIAQPGLTVGQRILNAVEASWQATGCNTNLGILLLAAPLVHAAVLQLSVRSVLDALTVDDAQKAFCAIVKASPGGLGRSDRHDVHAPAAVTLLQAMQEAAERDWIAYQYVSGFVDIVDYGLSRYRQAMLRWDNTAWAATAVYLGWLARQTDTHVRRKFNSDVAAELRAQAQTHEQLFLACDNPKNYMSPLLRWDAELKRAGINPGTSADFTVITLLLAQAEMNFCLTSMLNAELRDYTCIGSGLTK